MKQKVCHMLSHILNGQLAKRSFLYYSKSKNCERFLKLLWNEGFITGYQASFSQPKKWKIYLRYYKNKPVINSIKLISKPSRRIYCSADHIWKLSSNSSFIVISTCLGLKSIADCKKLKIGGELLMFIN